MSAAVRQVLESPSGAERREAVKAFVSSLEPGAEVLVVGATREAAAELLREIALERGVLFGPTPCSLGQLSARLAVAALAERGLSPATALSGEAAAARAAFALFSENRLARLRPLERAPGLPRALASTLADLRLAGVPRIESATNAETRELGELLTVLEGQMALAGAADRARLHALAVEALEVEALEAASPAALARGYVGKPVVFLDVPVRTAAERRLVFALLAKAPSALATVPTGEPRTREAFASAGLVAREAAPGVGGLGRLRRSLFAAPVPPGVEPAGDVIFFSAPGEGRECVEIARRLLAEAAAGTPFDRMAILLRAPEEYTPLLTAALSRAGVPSHVARGTRRPDPAGRAFLALLACAGESLSARRFAEYLSFAEVPDVADDGAPPDVAPGFVPPSPELAELLTLPPLPEPAEPAEADDGGDPPVRRGALRAPWRWEELLVEAAVIGGQDRWRRRLAGLEKELDLRLVEVLRDDPDAPLARVLARELTDLSHLSRFAVPVVERLAGFPLAAPWGEWLALLSALAPAVLRRPGRVLSVLSELAPLAEIGPVTLAEVQLVLHPRLTQLADEPAAHRGGRVFVGSPEDARGRVFDVVFVPGLAERLFPKPLREDPLLKDSLRRPLSPDLVTQADRALAERLLLRLAAGAAERRLVVSYPRLDAAEGRARVPSFYALDVVRAVEGRLPDVEELERVASLAAGARLGWPAPAEPAAAIDDLEYDLATLERWKRAPSAARRGRARYLLDVNPALARSLRARYQRWSRVWTGADGLMAGAADAAVLEPFRLSERPYSATALQRYAVCPYQFLLGAIHRLAPREEPVPVLRLDPLTRGRLVHVVLASLLRELLEKKLLPFRKKVLPWALEILERTLNEAEEKYRDELAPPIPRIWQDEIGTIRADLRTFLGKLTEAETDFVPASFELAFGLARDDEHDPASRPESATVLSRFKLRGSVDLVERAPGDGALRVTDYKTGKNRTLDGLVVGNGEVLQPMLYSLALEALLGAEVREARLLFCTAKGGFTERSVPLNAYTRGVAERALTLVARGVERGILLPLPGRDACERCDFRSVCGPHEERRVKPKKQHPVKDELHELRSFP